MCGTEPSRIDQVPARLADLLAGLSRLADDGFGLPVGSAARSCLLATRLAQSLDLPAADVQACFYTGLLHHVGCVGHAHETAQLFGDDLAANVAAGRTDSVSARDRWRPSCPCSCGVGHLWSGSGWPSML